MKYYKVSNKDRVAFNNMNFCLTPTLEVGMGDSPAECDVKNRRTTKLQHKIGLVNSNTSELFVQYHGNDPK